MKKVIVVLFLLGGAAGSWWWWQNLAGSTTTKPATVAPRTATVERRTLQSTVEAIGEVQPVNQVMVKSEISGRVKSVEVVTGQAVKKGELLALLDDTDLLTEKSAAETEIAGSRIRLEKAQRDYERQRNLYCEKLVSQEIYDNAKTVLDMAHNENEKSQRRLQVVEDKLKKVRIEAPFDGTVLNVFVSKGQVVSGATSVAQGTDLMSFADLNEMLIRAHINQVDAAKLRVEMPARITVDSLPGAVFTGRIIQIAPQATLKNNIKGFAVDVLVVKPDDRLRPGTNASLRFEVARVADALTLPLAAVFREGKDTVVYVAGASQPERRVVEVGFSNFRHCEIRSGVREGEAVLLERPVQPAREPVPTG